ncbi:MAG: isocitrate lyase [Firmicutes bacterium]|nr:isocitrate lyase [Bacillota bacterium]
MSTPQEAATLEETWRSDPRWAGITRPYRATDVLRLQGSVRIEHTLAERGAKRFWELLAERPFVPALGALTGNQAVEQVKAGLEAIYVSGWQVAADANLAGETYPDQSLYPANSVPALVRRINAALLRADQIEHREGKVTRDWLVPVVADAEAGFGGALNVFELTKAMIDAGAAAIHLEDQLSSEKKCGHMGGKVVLPTSTAVRNLIAARLAADVSGVPTVIIGRTDANGAPLITSDIDPVDQPFLTGERTPEGYFRFRSGIEAAIARGLAFAPYADVLWVETADPDIDEARAFAEAIHARFPGKKLAYNCSPSFNWAKKLTVQQMEHFQENLAEMGYAFQFVTLAGFHALNYSMFDLAHAYKARGMAAYSELQQREFAAEPLGYTATRHQREVGAGYYDEVALVISGGEASTTALKGSTEEAQFTTEAATTREPVSAEKGR